MPHTDSLILLLVAGYVFAFAFGMLANRLRLSPLVGYLVGGVAIGPFTPGFVADGDLANQLAEVGVILLMFGVGLHFSPRDLMHVRLVAVPGALVQVGFATFLGWAFGHGVLGMSDAEGILFGFALSVASTVVLLRALEERGQVQTEVGRIAVGWLIVEDLIVVVALVMLPLLFAPRDGELGTTELLVGIGWTLVKVATFVALMLVVGGRVLPWLFSRVALTRSRELFTLGVLAVALGIAYLAYAVFGASFALGAFIAGLTLNGTDLGHKAAERSLPLQDAFAVLFFVSVGMLFDPTILIERPLAIAGVLAIVVLGKGVAAVAISRVLGLPLADALPIAASLAQIGEFSFILSAIGVSFGIMSETTHELIVAAALLSITLNPLMFHFAGWSGREPPASVAPAGSADERTHA